MDTLAVCASIYPRFVFIMLKGSNLDCMPLPTFQKPLAQSSSAFVLTAGAFLVLVLAAAFGKWTFAACISLPNCVQVCLMREQICVKADLHSGFVSLWTCSFPQISLERVANLPDGRRISQTKQTIDDHVLVVTFVGNDTSQLTMAIYK